MMSKRCGTNRFPKFSDVYCAQLHELSGQAWQKPDAVVRAPNLMRFISHSNRVSGWVATSIVCQPKVRLRRKVMANMIALMDVRRRPKRGDVAHSAN